MTTRSPVRPGRALLAGLAAGAAGTTAPNVVTYIDVVVLAPPAPRDTAVKLAGELGIEIPDDEDDRANRIARLGPLIGIAAGLGVGA